ncbi:MAG: oligoendopeptidase F [Alphaproteobacteria bacterium]|nr:MAG: oligoendopeptidase F [Alphaproteobacteria bacterium]
MNADRDSEVPREAEGTGMAAGALPEWNLADLYAGMQSPAYRDDVARSQIEAEDFERRYKGRLAGLAADAADELGRAVGEYEAIEERMGRVISYAGLLHAGDTVDPAIAKFYGDAQERMTAASSHLLFFTLELNLIEDAVLEAAMTASPVLGRYRPWLEDLRREKPYQLEDRIERLFHEKSVTGRAAWNRLFDETLAELEFTVGGRSMPLEPALDLLQDRDRAVREQAAREIARVLKSQGRLFTQITNTLAKDKQISDDWRGFRDPADSRHLANRVEPEVVAALVEAVRSAFPRISHRYYRMKARALGLDRMQFWDRNAPLPHVPEKEYGWEDARAVVLDAYQRFSPAMAEIAGRFFDLAWIDAPVRRGKAPGAFSHPTVPSVHPYVMLNYLGRPRDVMTLAHELGHGVHQVLAADQGALMAQTPLTLAETASVFGEMLTFRSLLERAAGPQERRVLLAQKIEDMINTVVRQIAFYLFERKVHHERRNGELTQDQLGDFWMAVQADSLGDSFTLDDDYRSYWSYIPHFIHSPFYVYAYAFGDCLVNSLYAVYQSAGNGFEARYLAMLKAGGTMHHRELLAPFGLDASEPAFWQKGLSVIEGLIDELEGIGKGVAA